jgi:hypothetical protein
LNFADRFSKSSQISKFTKIGSMGAKTFHADGRTDREKDRHNEVDSRFSNFANAPEKEFEASANKA